MTVTTGASTAFTADIDYYEQENQFPGGFNQCRNVLRRRLQPRCNIGDDAPQYCDGEPECWVGMDP